MADEAGSGLEPTPPASPPEPPVDPVFRDPAQPPYWQRQWSWSDALKEPRTFFTSALERLGDKPTQQAVLDSAATGGPIGTGMAGPIKYTNVLGEEGRLLHRYDWAPTQEALDRWQSELYGSGSTSPDKPNVMQNILLASASEPGGSDKMIKVGFDKLKQAWKELQPLLGQQGIDTLEFSPYEGQLRQGPNVSKEARVRLFEILTGGKAEPTGPWSSYYQLPVKPGPPAAPVTVPITPPTAEGAPGRLAPRPPAQTPTLPPYTPHMTQEVLRFFDSLSQAERFEIYNRLDPQRQRPVFEVLAQELRARQAHGR